MAVDRSTANGESGGKACRKMDYEKQRKTTISVENFEQGNQNKLQSPSTKKTKVLVYGDTYKSPTIFGKLLTYNGKITPA